jgi:hypothetical protein
MLGVAAPSTTPAGGPGYAVRVSPEVALLIRALTEYGSEVEIVDLAAYLLSAVRQNDKRPAKLEVICPDEIVKSLQGEPRMRGRLLAAWIPAVVLEDLARVVVTPQEAAAGGGPLIVTP